MYRDVQETKKLSVFTSVQKKVTILFLVHSIAWASEQKGEEEVWSIVT